ncbi:beta-ketoacyl synthase N-terminal-like domain-containing protein [Actinophytocola algeriensis]|uniref:Acyl transferase domain-containing protein n=1 Tax=Actinophytocola algeriensis TaxID=1768010 RepID=A0A7W7Q9M1_9PSEU|nr:beta-ketoacyl synthase N-terminal-like domain-containing protein [Actinophytocola algeriensis]MBB4909443.1 acyl transferase domain-containing protein [Actinophytocola algeriensis]MBE1475433.1 acyl transferase domain-containing protein [Actinophytocola algeriensis]
MADQDREQKLVEYLKRVTGDLVEAKERLAAVAAAAAEPLAVVGMSCRLPGGGDTPARYWQALTDGVDAMAEVPADRWRAADYFDADPTAPGKAYTQRGGFLRDIAGWDAAFFGISPQEALRIDPQHRLLFELVWEALEDAGIPAESLRGSKTGVFLGLVDSRQYLQLEAEAEGVASIDDPYLTMGGSASAAAGRLAYQFDLRGPVMTVDTACSSSLVALDLAVQSLRRGEIDRAIVCSSSAIIHPVYFVQFAKMGMLAPDGKAKVFDEAGNGYTLGEGGGAVILTRASDAGDRRVHALVRGSAVNSDGRSNGLTAPNKVAQIAVLRSALANAGLKPDDLDFLEAQGTGSALGDAIEFGALLEVFGDRAADHPLLVGAVKANIGHLVASSGLASLVKAIQAVKHGAVPGNLHLTTPNPVVTLDGPVRPVLGNQPLPSAPGAPRRAGISAFGWSGTNAHVIIEQAPATEQAVTPDEEWQLLTLSAGSEAGLAALATALADHLESTPDLALADVAHTVQKGRSALRVRRALVCRDVADAVARLRSGFTGTQAAAGKQALGFVVGDTAWAADLAAVEPAFDAADPVAALGRLLPIAASGTAEELAGRVDVVLAADPGAGQVALRTDGRPEWLATLGRLWELGVPVRWAGAGQFVDLPTYPFQRTRFWPNHTPTPFAREEHVNVERFPRPDLRAPFLPAGTPTERAVTQAWEEHLGIDAIGVNDPFFELGGTSMIGLAVVTRLAKEYDVELSAASLFERPTPAQFAELLDSLTENTVGTENTADAAPRPTAVDAQAARGARRRAIAQARKGAA